MQHGVRMQHNFDCQHTKQLKM